MSQSMSLLLSSSHLTLLLQSKRNLSVLASLTSIAAARAAQACSRAQLMQQPLSLLLSSSHLTLLLQSKIHLSVLASLTSIAAARAAQVWSRAQLTRQPFSSLPAKLTYYNVAAEQDQPVSAGESDQHCSSACCSSVEPGAADAAADAGRHDPGAV